MTSGEDDRTVHARGEFIEVVRYDRAGKWYIEDRAGENPRVATTLTMAAGVAIGLRRAGGTVFLDRSGGRAFDRKVRMRQGDDAEARP